MLLAAADDKLKSKVQTDTVNFGISLLLVVCSACPNLLHLLGKKNKSKRMKWRGLVHIASPDHPLDLKVLNRVIRHKRSVTRCGVYAPDVLV